MFKMPLAVFLLLILSSPVLAQGKGRAIYMGGTVATIEDNAGGRIDLKDPEKFVFTPSKGTKLEIPWSAMEPAEYGQKASRRVLTAVAISPVALFSKSRQHYVSLAWKDADDKNQAVVLRMDKRDIRAALSVIKARTGKEILMQDEEAAKQMGYGNDKK